MVGQNPVTLAAQSVALVDNFIAGIDQIVGRGVDARTSARAAIPTSRQASQLMAMTLTSRRLAAKVLRKALAAT